MAWTGFEWIIVLVVLVVLFLWGPERLPKIAKAFGQAKKEFEKASKEATTLQGQEAPKPSQQADVGALTDEKLIEVAQTLGITTEGKSREALIQEIKSKLATN
ncbi:MAG: twin-arginine translocase TatA/TatE family subunit [Nitrososphaerota archaeon]|nr:twin-arginine translocase TatA/TatE family subunit [Candidatus Calditenuaceae archaeon]MDW8072647.1 twin-arginine translocase TatA/TatE family subunit [Nitrososphaerota archaeon]